MAMVAASIQISVPLSFGIFKQQASVSVDKIEDSFHNRVNRFGQPVTRVFYNKGVWTSLRCTDRLLRKSGFFPGV